MQTFVLAPQDRNKYYVHNDIFRYQDEVFSEEEEDENQVEPNTAVDSHSMEQQRGRFLLYPFILPYYLACQCWIAKLYCSLVLLTLRKLTY